MKFCLEIEEIFYKFMGNLNFEAVHSINYNFGVMKSNQTVIYN